MEEIQKISKIDRKEVFGCNGLIQININSIKVINKEFMIG